MATEIAELAAGPWDGFCHPVAADAAEMLVWYRGGESIDMCAKAAGTLVHIALEYPTRHRYVRTARRTAGGATVFRHAGRMVGLFE